jgi:hypothetical protein
MAGCAAAATDAGLLFWEAGEKEAAVGWYVRAAEDGDATAAFNLGVAYLMGEGVAKDESVAVRCALNINEIITLGAFNLSSGLSNGGWRRQG